MSGKHYLLDENKSLAEGMSKSEITDVVNNKEHFVAIEATITDNNIDAVTLPEEYKNLSFAFVMVELTSDAFYTTGNPAARTFTLYPSLSAFNSSVGSKDNTIATCTSIYISYTGITRNFLQIRMGVFQNNNNQLICRGTSSSVKRPFITSIPFDLNTATTQYDTTVTRAVLYLQK